MNSFSLGIFQQQAISMQALIKPGTNSWESADAFSFLFFDKDFAEKQNSN
jgi:hypothetical protein